MNFITSYHIVQPCNQMVAVSESISANHKLFLHCCNPTEPLIWNSDALNNLNKDNEWSRSYLSPSPPLRSGLYKQLCFQQEWVITFKNKCCKKLIPIACGMFVTQTIHVLDGVSLSAFKKIWWITSLLLKIWAKGKDTYIKSFEIANVVWSAIMEKTIFLKDPITTQR